jgi:two-component system phosphate regulon sensor histidine kinase PhoR
MYFCGKHELYKNQYLEPVIFYQLKRIFTIITVLISLSLIGIIAIQISWIKNMILLREEQIKEKLTEAVTAVGEELAEHKGSYAAGGKKNMLTDNFSLNLFKPNTISQQFSVLEIKDIINKAFSEKGLKDVNFEFGIAAFGANGIENSFNRISENFGDYYADTVTNDRYYSSLVPPSGSAGENLSPDEMLLVVVPKKNNFVLQSLMGRIITSVVFTLIILAAFYLTVRTLLRQKKLGEIKNDFINNMTHEFKTPIATISLAVDAMKNEKVISDRDKLSYFSGIIKEENQRMNRQVETILKASQLEKQEVDLNLEPVHIHEVIHDVVDNFNLQLEDKKGKVELLLNAKDDLVKGDEVHLLNMVNNLVDNAVKYAKDNVPPVVKVTTQSNGKNFTLKIEDNGIGMNRDTVKRVFERFYRAHTGNVHNVKGFGLGLSYVKTMVDAHHGTIKAESVLGKGSSFCISLPLPK